MAESGSSAGVDDAAAAEPVPTSIIIDASGSMKAEDAPGQRFEAVRSAFHGLVDAVPDGQQTALLTYGTETGSSDDEAAAGCQDVKTLAELGAIDKKKYLDEVDGLEPSGYTPIALALQKADAQLPKTGERAIILLSDGLDTCGDEGDQLDPCTVARDLGADGGLTIHTVGLRVDGQTSKQLECLADETGGTSWDAVNDKQLDSRLVAAIQPALAEERITPDGYKGLQPGMTADEAREAGGFTNEISAEGRVEIIYVDCTLVFDDGVLTEIVSTDATTLDGVKVGDDISKAEKVYADPDTPTQVTDDGAALYTADPIAGTGFKVYFDGADAHQPGKNLRGEITKIVMCACATTDSYSVAPPPVGIFPRCMVQSRCTIVDSVQVQHPKQGPLTLVMLSQELMLGDDAGGQVYVVDADGKVTDLEGNVPSGNPTEVWPTYVWPSDELTDHFHFMVPATDRSGMIFMVGPSDDSGTISAAMGVDPNGYFDEGSDHYTLDDSELPRPPVLDYWSRKWGEIDDHGYYTLILYDEEAHDGIEHVFHRKGDTYEP